MSEKELQDLQARGKAHVQNDSDHHLPLGFRRAVWAELGPRAKAYSKPAGAHLRRTNLAVASVRHVLPYWKKHFPKNDLPRTILKEVEKVVSGELKPEKAKKLFDTHWQALTDLGGETSFPEVAVGFAAARALWTALYDEFFDPAKIDTSLPDGDDPETWDSAFYASVAQAGGVLGDPDADAGRRGEFWRWWLDEAVMPKDDGGAL